MGWHGSLSWSREQKVILSVVRGVLALNIKFILNISTSNFEFKFRIQNVWRLFESKFQKTKSDLASPRQPSYLSSQSLQVNLSFRKDRNWIKHSPKPAKHFLICILNLSVKHKKSRIVKKERNRKESKSLWPHFSGALCDLQFAISISISNQ